MHQKMSFGELPHEETQHRSDAVAGKRESASFTPSTKMQYDTEKARSAGQGVKECPVCHARCFADMDVCYNCLHSFGRSRQVGVDGTMPSSEKKVNAASDSRCLNATGEIGAMGLAENECAEPSLESQNDAAYREIGEVDSSSKGSGSTKTCSRTLELGKILEIVISISLSQDACSRHGVAPVVKVETR